jgi:ribose transport system substrate-binding protein
MSSPLARAHISNKGHHRLRHQALALAAAGALVLAACGGDDDSDSGDTTEASAETTAAAATVTTVAAGSSETTAAAATGGATDYSEPPTELTVEGELSAVPEKKEVAFVVCADPSCATLAEFLKESTGALGWDLTTINASATDPGAAIQQAVDAGVDYIALTGSDMAQYAPAMAQATSQGIPVFACYATDVPAGEANNLYSDCYDGSSAAVYAGALMDWIATDSAGAANILAVTLPAFPILGAQVDAAEAELKELCADCTFEVLEQTIENLVSGATPQAIASYLQTHTDINYVYLSYNGLDTGVVDALKSAGVDDQVKIVGTQGGAPQFQQIVAGTETAWSALPQEYAMWILTDQMARHATGDWTLELERQSAVAPFYIVSDPAQAEELVDLENGWAGPEGFKDAFKALWGV